MRLCGLWLRWLRLQQLLRSEVLRSVGSSACSPLLRLLRSELLRSGLLCPSLLCSGCQLLPSSLRR
jgi:hypothetical protein